MKRTIQRRAKTNVEGERIVEASLWMGKTGGSGGPLVGLWAGFQEKGVREQGQEGSRGLDEERDSLETRPWPDAGRGGRLA